MISQLTVFLENEKGRLASACQAIADADLNMHALFLADTESFGIARIFCDEPERAAQVLNEAGHRASITPVIAVRVPNEPGGLAALLRLCDEADLNIEYGYCFLNGEREAVDVLKIDDPAAEDALADGGFEIVAPEEIYRVD